MLFLPIGDYVMPKLPSIQKTSGSLDSGRKLPNYQDEGWCFMGIDPGKSGGVSIISNTEVWTYVAPSTEKDMWDIIEGWDSSAVAIIEHVTSSPQMGVVSAFTFGMGYGALRMALTASGIPYEPIRPQVWQKALGITPRKKTESKPDFKNRLRAKAQQLFPNLPIWKEPKSKGRQLAICDSLLIAEFCRRKYKGQM